uniref:Uncharacterized protein LOC114344201 n=1 Tax=Diabrotica virgifera virgifera TaxID=50390 RepID=A0A6P7GMH9_DIAVI
MATPPMYEDSRKVGPNLFQELSSEESEVSTEDEQPKEEKARDEEFQFQKRGRKKGKKPRKDTEENEEDKGNPTVEIMDEDEADEAARGTTKRARTARPEDGESDVVSEDELQKAREETEKMRDLMKRYPEPP